MQANPLRPDDEPIDIDALYGQAKVCIACHYAKECVDIRAARPGTCFEALELLRQSQRPDGALPGGGGV